MYRTGLYGFQGRSGSSYTCAAVALERRVGSVGKKLYGCVSHNANGGGSTRQKLDWQQLDVNCILKIVKLT